MVSQADRSRAATVAIKTCPWCDGEAQADDDVETSFVFCVECLARGPAVELHDNLLMDSAKEIAIRHWNAAVYRRKFISPALAAESQSPENTPPRKA